MASRKPLALVSGDLLVVPATDTLDAAAERLAGTWAADEVPKWNGASFSPKLTALVELAAAFTVPGTSLADITGLSVALPRAGTYRFTAALHTASSVNNSLIGHGVNFTAAITRIFWSTVMSTNTTAVALGASQANNTVSPAAATRNLAATALPVLVNGVIVAAAPGTLSLRAQRSAGVYTIGAGSFLQVVED